MPGDKLWDIEDVATYLKLPASAVYKMTSSKSSCPIPHLRVGSRLRFRREEIDRWLELYSVSPLDSLERARDAARKAVTGR